ncbi:FH1/FH2 domain-containing protein 1 [Engraulis encrasicolus]|uniref:FH1/FH2 domain-containing protein 1 n=1 Tax=Engraulis encrasicolus TaxID=184585 RepID=UPI002FD72C71
MKHSDYLGADQSWACFTRHLATPRLRLNTLDFSDLWDDEDIGLDAHNEDSDNAFASTSSWSDGSLPPTPPVPPPLPPCAPPLPPGFASPSHGPTGGSGDGGNGSAGGGGSRTLKLHWRELQSLPPVPRVCRFGQQSIWAGLEPVRLDTNRLEFLFESKSRGATNGALRSLMMGRQKQPCVSVLGVKRSNIITIALSSLPPPHLLPPAIYSMDCCVLDREDVQKLQALVPTDEELKLIKEAKAQSPRCPLAPAEHCLQTLGGISHLSPRLQLWAFALDYDTLEREIAEPLFHLKLAMEQLAANETFRCILATVLAIGNFLNGCKARGFELSYLAKLSQVRDTHGRQPLLHHVCLLLLQVYPQCTDLYSDITAVSRASKCDYTQVQANLSQLEAHCKASWEQLKLLEKDGDKKAKGRASNGGTGGNGGNGGRAGNTGCNGSGKEGSLRHKLPEFLKECEERLKVLRAVHRRVINRFHAFLLFLGYSRSVVRETSAETFCKTVSDFALEYRTTRQGILQQREREKEKEKEHDMGIEGEKKGGSRTPQSKPKQRTQTQPQEYLEQFKLEELLRTPESSIKRLDFMMPRQRSRTPDRRNLLTRKLKW